MERRGLFAVWSRQRIELKFGHREVSAVVRQERATLLNSDGRDNYVGQCDDSTLLRPEVPKPACMFPGCGIDCVALQRIQKESRSLFLARTNSSVDLRDIDCCSGQAMAVVDETRQQLFASIAEAQCVDQNRGVEQESQFGFSLCPSVDAGSRVRSRLATSAPI